MSSIQKSLSYHEQLHAAIKERIITGVYTPGDRLYEAQLAREFEVSRSPVREAMRTLEQEGLITVDSRSRLSVYKPSVQDVEDIYQCRQVLESLAVSLVCERGTETEINRIHELLAQAESKFNEEDDASLIQLISLNSQFHDAIISASHNFRLREQLDKMRALTFFYRRMNVENRQRCREILDQHAKIATHLLQRDQQAAADAMHHHIATDLAYLIKILHDHTG